MNRSVKLGIVIATVSVLLVMLPPVQKPAQSQGGPTEAPAGFDNLTNGHDIGTHDPIVQNGGPETFNKVRTAPLWGLRTRTSDLHDLSAPTVTQTIQSHHGQAQPAADAFDAVPQANKKQLLQFLESL